MANVNTGWGEYTDDAAAETADVRKRAGSGEWIKWENGDTVFRVCPPRAGTAQVFKIVKIHRIPIPGKSYSMKVLCPGSCEVDDKRSELFETKNKADGELARELRPQVEALFWAINRDNEEAGPMKARVSQKVYDQIEKIRRGTGGTGGDFTHPTRGFDLVMTKVPAKSAGNDSDFPMMTVSASRSNSLLGTEEQNADWIPKVKPLDEIDRFITIEEAKELMAGRVPDDIGGQSQRQIENPAPPAEASHQKVGDIVDAVMDDEGDDEAF